jgi:hypothetical protein
MGWANDDLLGGELCAREGAVRVYRKICAVPGPLSNTKGEIFRSVQKLLGNRPDFLAAGVAAMGTSARAQPRRPRCLLQYWPE